MIALQSNTPTLRVCETIDSQASGAASAPRFSAINVITGGLTPNSTHFDQVTRSVSEGDEGKRLLPSPSLTLRVSKVSAIGLTPPRSPILSQELSDLRFAHGLFLVSLVVVSLIGSLAVALADDDVVDAVGVDPRFVVSEQQFDQTVFNTRGAVVIANGGQLKQVVVSQTTPIEQAKSQLETLLNAEIAKIDLRCNLTEAQKKKLRLAGRGDVADLFARAMEVRRRCTSEPLTQQEYSKLTMEMQGLRMVIQSGSFGDSTLFRKTMRGLLSVEQSDLYRILERERRAAMVTEALAINWGQNAKPVRLSVETQKKFVEVMLEHGHLPTNPNLYRHYIVLIEIGRLEGRLKPLLTDDEWQQLQFPLGQAQRVEQFLRTSGQWPIELADDEESSEATKE